MSVNIYSNGELTPVAGNAAGAANLNDNGKKFIFGYRNEKYGYYDSETKSDDTFHEFGSGNPYLRYDEETGYIQAKDEDGNWVNIYRTAYFPLSKNRSPVYKLATTGAVGDYAHANLEIGYINYETGSFVSTSEIGDISVKKNVIGYSDDFIEFSYCKVTSTSGWDFFPKMLIAKSGTSLETMVDKTAKSWANMGIGFAEGYTYYIDFNDAQV